MVLGGVDPVSLRADDNVYYNYIHDSSPTTRLANAYGVAISAFAGYSSGWPKYTTVRYNYIENIQSWEGIDTHGGQYLYFQDNYIKNCRTGVFMQLVNGSGGLAAIGDHLYVQRNVIEMPASPTSATPQYFIW